ncbi:MAG: hypothetical protein ACR2K0_01785 [Acidimicrobiales bacterium]
MTARPKRRFTGDAGGGVRLIVASALVASVLSTPGSDDPDQTGGPEAHAEVSPLDVLASDGAPLAKRLGPIVGLTVAVLWLVRRRWR